MEKEAKVAMTNSEPGIESRLDALELSVRSLTNRMDQLTKLLSAQPAVLSLHHGIALDSEDNAQTGGLIESQDSGAAFDRIVQGELLTRLAVVCFLLVVALALRTIAENEILQPRFGVALGIVYCFSLVGWSLAALGRSREIRLTVGICGLILLGIIVFESSRFLHEVSLQVSFLVFLGGMSASIAVGTFNKMACVSWLGLTGYPIVFAALTFPEISYFSTGVLIFLGLCASIVGQSRWRTRPARVTLGFVLFLFLFEWNANLNGMYRVTGAEHYQQSVFFLLSIVSFSILLLIPSVNAALSRQPLSSFEKMSPTVTSVLAYYFAASELQRAGSSSIPYDEIALVVALMLILLGVRFGVRDPHGHFGLRTFLGAGIVLLLLSFSSVFTSALYQSIILSLLAGVAFLSSTAFRLRTIDLRFISYLLSGWALLVAWLGGVLASPLASLSARIALAGFMGAIALLHYLASRGLVASSGLQVPENVAWLDRFRVIPGVCFCILWFVAGINAMKLVPAFSVFERCGQSVWLTVIASAVLLIGNHYRDREITVVGIAALCLAAVKVFFIDLMRESGLQIVVSVFTFGVLAGINSYFLQQRVESQDEHGKLE